MLKSNFLAESLKRVDEHAMLPVTDLNSDVTVYSHIQECNSISLVSKNRFTAVKLFLNMHQLTC